MSFYQTSVPDTSGYSNVSANPLGSNYASTFGQPTNDILARVVNEVIYNTAPQQFLDLGVIFAKSPKVVMSDEWEWFEAPYDRVPLQATAAVAAGATQVVPVTSGSISNAALNMTVTYPDNTTGIISAMNVAGLTVTVSAPTGGTLTAVAANDLIALNANVDADGTTVINPTYRMNTTRRYNFVQDIAIKQRFGKRELMKYQHANLTTNYLSMQRERMIFHYKVDKSNALWNGQRTEVTSAEGIPTKLTGGIDYFMNTLGSPSTTVSTTNLASALESLTFATEYGAYGKTRFLFGTPAMLNEVSKTYKRNLIRYAPTNNKVAELGLNKIDLDSSSLVFVPMKRFGDESSFPAAQGFKNRLYCLDLDMIQPVISFPDHMGETLDRNNGSLNKYIDQFIEGSVGLEFPNPKGCFKIIVTP